ncbi:MAG: hypothetical protein Q9166_006218 [cf. Caloplaca sp. 2 TL-2023]
MQVGSRGSSLLRSHPSLLIFLAPSISSNLSVTPTPCHIYLAISKNAILQRSISIRPGLRQASSAAAAAPQQPSPEDDRAQGFEPSLRPQPRSSEGVKRRQISLLDRFRNPKRDIQAPMSEADRAREIDSLLGKSRDPLTSDPNRSTTATRSENDQDESIADMVLRKRAESRRQDFAAAQGERSRQGSIARGMNMPELKDTISRQHDMIHIQEPTRAVATIKSRPSLGRTVEVMPERGLDLGRALKSLEINCAINNVRGDAQSQRFHERPGAKRKRLHSLRWRRRFKMGFNAVVGKVRAMRRKGW